MPNARSIPNARLTGTCTSAGTAFALPTNKATRLIRLETDGDAFVGMGTSGTPPAASTSNTAYHAGQEDYFLDGVYQTDGSYFYVYSQDGSTITAKLSFFN